MSEPARKLETNSQSPAPTLTLVNDCPRAMSTDVAAYFGKQHQHVMRQIRQIVANCPELFSASNFGRAEYTDDQGKPRPCYSMTRDGFTLLAMGFTGPKAMQFKISYIEAFNAMEAELAARGRAGFQLTGDTRRPEAKSTVKDRRPLANIVNTWVGLAPISHRDAWHQVNVHFMIDGTKDLPLGQVREACAWVQERIDRLGMSHDLPALPPTAPKPLLALMEGQPVTLPDMEQVRREGQAIMDAMDYFIQLVDPFFEAHREFRDNMRHSAPLNPVVRKLNSSLDFSGTYISAVHPMRILTTSLVYQIINSYELVAALQRGQEGQS